LNFDQSADAGSLTAGARRKVAICGLSSALCDDRSVVRDVLSLFDGVRAVLFV